MKVTLNDLEKFLTYKNKLTDYLGKERTYVECSVDFSHFKANTIKELIQKINEEYEVEITMKQEIFVEDEYFIIYLPVRNFATNNIELIKSYLYLIEGR